MNRNGMVLGLLFFSTMTYSQNDSLYLTLDEAVKQALENNPEVVVSRYDTDIAKNDATIGNAGLLPTLSISGSYTKELNDAYLEFASPQQEAIDRSGASSTTYNAALQLNYNLFGGFEKYNRYESLLISSDISNLQTRLIVESTITRVFQVYLETARLLEQAEIDKEAVATSLARYRRMEERYEFGGASKLEVLNAQVDLNQDSITWMRTLTDLANNKRTLMVLIGKAPDANFSVQTEFDIEKDIELSTVMERALDNNVNLVLAQLQRESATIAQSIAGAARYPRLDFSASYGYRRTENEAGFISLQENVGLSGSVNVSYTLFGGLQVKRELENAEVGLAKSEENLHFAKMQVSRDVLNAFETYQNNLFLLNIAQDDIATARLNFQRSQEAYLTGQINSTEFRQAQLNLIQAAFRINQLRIQAKLSEVELYRLAGILVQ